MIPVLVPRRQLLAANGIFTLTLNAAFALGFALLGPLVVNVAGPEAVILVVAGLYFLAAVFCFTLPASPPPPPAEADAHTRLGVGEAEAAVGSTFAQLREGFSFIRANRSIGWSLIYLAITASLVGVLGVLGPAFAKETLGLAAEDFVVVVLPLGFGIVTGILLLNSYGRYFPPAPGHRGRPDRPRHPAGGPVGGRPDQPLPPARRRAGRPRPVGASPRCSRSSWSSRSSPGSPTAWSPSRPRRSSRRTCRRTSAVASSASSACSCRSRASCRSSSSGRSRTSSGRPRSSS